MDSDKKLIVVKNYVHKHIKDVIQIIEELGFKGIVMIKQKNDNEENIDIKID